MGKAPRISDRMVALVGLLGAGMAGLTRFTDGMPRGPSWLDVVFLLAIAALLIGFGRSFGRALSNLLHGHMDESQRGGYGRAVGSEKRPDR